MSSLVSQSSPETLLCPRSSAKIPTLTTSGQTQWQWPSVITRQQQHPDLHPAVRCYHQSQCVPSPQLNKSMTPCGIYVPQSCAPSAINALHGINAAPTAPRRGAAFAALILPYRKGRSKHRGNGCRLAVFASSTELAEAPWMVPTMV